MTNKDYSQGEIDIIIDELLTVHVSKLRPAENKFVRAMENLGCLTRLTQEQRDLLIKLYDSIGEADY